MSTSSHALPIDLADVALTDAATCAAAGSVSVSWWHEAVRTGLAPQPVFRRVRCTRWRVKDVAEFWRAQSGSVVTLTSAVPLGKAVMASAAASKKRGQSFAGEKPNVDDSP